MQDLVGIGVADAAEKPGVGQRALERVVLGEKAFAEGFDTGVGDFEPA